MSDLFGREPGWYFARHKSGDIELCHWDGTWWEPWRLSRADEERFDKYFTVIEKAEFPDESKASA